MIAAMALWLAVAAPSAFPLPLAGVSASGLTCFGQPATIVGSEGNDQLGGTPGADVIVALAGDDKISAAGGRDLICSGSGADIVSAEGGNDSVSAGSEDDQVLGGNGVDRLIGGPAVDGCTGGAGTDVIRRCEGRARKNARLELQDEAPTAVPDTLSLSEDTAATTQVLGNDTDRDNGLKAVQSVGRPQHGSATISNERTSVTYSPDPDFCGADSVSYALNGGSSATISISIACIEDPPLAIDDSFGLSEDDSSKSLSVLVNDHDVDAGPISIGSMSDPSHGTAEIEGTDAIFYTPSPDYCGIDSFTYMLSSGSSATVLLEVACIDDPPSAVADSANLNEDDPSTPVSVLANDTDIDAGPMTVAAKTEPAHGTVLIGEGNGGVAYGPVADYCGPDTFTYTVNGGSSTTVSINVACIDDPPVAVNDSFEVSENDDSASFPVLANDTDVDSGPSISIVEVTQPTQGTASIVEGGTAVEFRPESGYCNDSGPSETFTYTLNGGSTGTVAVSVECLANSSTAVAVSAAPEVFPAFERGIDDYVVRCDGTPLDVSATLAPGYSISVDGQAQEEGSVEASVPLRANQQFAFTVFHGQGRHRYFVRCLPADFPAFSVERTGPTEAQWYVVTPSIFASPPGVSAQYSILFDKNGAPIWWMRSAGATMPLDAKLLPNGNITWLHFGGGGMEERQLDGTLSRALDTVGGTADHHEVLLLPNGNYILGRYPASTGIDMTGCGGSASGTLIDAEVQELTPAGSLVWSWKASDHISFSEVPDVWKDQCSGDGDIYHFNSVEPDGDGYVISFRHLNAVYRVDRETGNIDWKLGGMARPESLTVVGDPLSATSTFGGQHDARILADGTLTVFDNGTGQRRPPRSVRFSIDADAGTATLLEDVRDVGTPASQCCGSTRRMPGGNWITAWGGFNPYITEQTGSGERAFTLNFTQGFVTYRVNPVLPGELSAAALRAGMDAQYPR
jgi:Arylsulfotransferase (ASST)/Bacterial Ig domain/Bacterial cadherin-like domain/RTX calcium-binding nonapeptide repeat (4 copies)